MYVCLCHGFTDRDVRAALDGGAQSTAQVYRACAGCGPECGRCVEHVRGMIRERRTAEAAADGPELFAAEGMPVAAE
jgi:bacterioferritin-associated ferredoxin